MLTVKAAADETGLTVKGIRFYEKIGLIRPAERSPQNINICAGTWRGGEGAQKFSRQEGEWRAM